MDLFLAGVIKMALLCGTALSCVALVLFSRRKPARIDTRAIEEMSARLERIEHAVDTIAIEVERVSEGQRFTSKLLAEKAREQVPGRGPERQITPH